MFLDIGDKKVATVGQYESLKEDCQKSDEDEGSRTQTPNKLFTRRDILHSVLIGIAFFAFAWITMNMSKNQSPSMASVEVQIAQVTLAKVNTTKTILADVEEKSSTLRKHHQLIAAHFLDTISDDLTQQTNISVQNISRMVEQTIHEINQELTSFEQGVSDGFNGFTTEAIDKLQKIQASVASKNDNVTIANLAAQATNAINMLLKDTEQMYLFFTRRLTNILEYKLQNTTDRMSLLLHSQRRFIAAKMIDRINLCYNVCTQNTKTSRLLKSIVDAMSSIGETTDVINGLKSIHQSNDEHAQQLVTESKSALAEIMTNCQSVLNKLLEDDFNYLGSAVTKMAAQKHGSFKQSLLKSLTSAVEALSTRWNSITSNFEVIRKVQRRRIIEDVQKSVSNLMDAINANAKQDGQNEELKNFSNARSTLVEKFDEITSTVNSVFINSQKYTSESLHNYLQFNVDRQVASIPTLSIQNFIPDDLCPVAMNYQSYISFTLNAALGRNVPDGNDDFFSVNSIFGTFDLDDDQETNQVEPVQSDDVIKIIVMTFDDEIQEPDTNGDSSQNQIGASSAGNYISGNSISSNSQNFSQIIPPLLRDLLKNMIGEITSENVDDTKKTNQPAEIDDYAQVIHL